MCIPVCIAQLAMLAYCHLLELWKPIPALVPTDGISPLHYSRFCRDQSRNRACPADYSPGECTSPPLRKELSRVR